MVAINWTNITDFGSIPELANTSSNGSFWVSMLYMTWIILLLLMSAFGFEVAITVSSFLALLIGLILVYAQLIALKWLLIFVGILLFMFLYIIWSSKKS